MARAALVSYDRLMGQTEAPDFYRAKLATARFYAEHVLPQATALGETVCHGAAATVDYPEALLTVA